jgi:hypothetical protein
MGWDEWNYFHHCADMNVEQHFPDLSNHNLSHHNLIFKIVENIAGTF